MKIVVGCSGAKTLAKTVAKKSKLPYSDLVVEKFPDNENKIRFKIPLKNKTIFLVQSYFGNISDKILESLFALYTAKDLGAREVILVASYFPYLRQDKRFKSSEGINALLIAKLFSVFDQVLIVEPHLHRFRSFKDFFLKAKKISIAAEITNYIKKNFKDYVLIGPDQESVQWIKPVALKLKTQPIILRKQRLTPKKVKVSKLKIAKRKARHAIIIDDIISTGGTMIEAAKEARKVASKVCFIGIHGIFAQNTLPKLKKFGTVVSTNSIPSAASKIDISDAIATTIKKFK